MRLLLVPALALSLGLAPMALAAADDVPAPIAATLEKNSRVRFGPSTGAKEIVTLKAGAQVEVFGPCKSAAEWLVIRFPKEGKVWIHAKNLAAVDGGARFRVTADKTRARADATLSAEVVAELNQGEIVEDKGAIVGDWRAVTIPDAVAYVHQSLVQMPADLKKAMAEREAKAAAADATWQKALAVYTQYLETVKANPKAAINLDWAGLAVQLDAVVADHASASVRLAAKRVRDSIAQLLPAATEVAVQQGVQPPAPLIKSEEPKPADAKPGEAKPPVATAADGPKPLSAEAVQQMQKAMPKPSPWQAEGILMQDDQWTAKVGTRDVLMDGDGNVVAFIKGKDGVDLKLSELLYREVGAQGAVETLPPEKTGLPKAVKLVTASDVAPLRR
jgi:uncharacterized protein YgiM (DUF1202 family)